MTELWQNRIVTTEPSDVDPMTLRGHTKNIRTHASAQRRLLESALDELGHVGKIVVSARTRRVLNGHLRVELAIGRDAPTIPVTWIDVDEDEELIVLAFFDQIGEGADIDPAKLKATFSRVKADSEGLQTMLADWAASYQVTIVPARPTLRAAAPIVSAPVAVVAEQAPALVARPGLTSFPAGEALAITPVWPDAEPIAALPTAEALPVRASPQQENPNSALDAQNFSEPEQPEADMFASALALDRQVVKAEPLAEVKAPKPEKAAPTTAVVTVGEYTQNIDLARFTPWWGALVIQCDNDGAKLAAEIKARLGFGA